MRKVILDTYFGEGELHAEKQHFDACYVKLSHGPYNYLSKASKARDVTMQILESAAEHYDAVGGYTYPIAADPYTGDQQADAYLEAVETVRDFMGIDIKFHVIDIERAQNVDAQGNYYGKYAVKTKKIAQRLAAEFNSVSVFDANKNKVALYLGPYTYRELFVRWAHVWAGYQDNFPFIIAEYPSRGWNDYLANIPNSKDRPWLLPEIPAENVIMWQYSDKYPAGDFFPDSAEADVNVWMKSHLSYRRFMGLPLFDFKRKGLAK